MTRRTLGIGLVFLGIAVFVGLQIWDAGFFFEDYPVQISLAYLAGIGVIIGGLRLVAKTRPAQAKVAEF